VGRSGSRAFLWEAGTLHDLNERLAPDSSGWMILDAIDIDAAGQILARGRQGARSADVLLVPVPEPAAASLGGLAALALAALARRRRKGALGSGRAPRQRVRAVGPTEARSARGRAPRVPAAL
jgi:hypothetical protein